MFCERPESFSGERNKYSCFFLLAFILFFITISTDACVRPINKCTPLKCQSMPFVGIKIIIYTLKHYLKVTDFI